MTKEDNNKDLIKEYRVKEIDLRVDRLQNALPTYLFFGKNLLGEYRTMTLNQLEIELDCAMKYRIDDLDEIIKENSSAFIENDFSNSYYKRSHKTYPEIRKALTLWFACKVVMAGELMYISGKDFYEIVRKRFINSEEAVKVFLRETIAAEQVFDLIENNPGLISVPFGIGVEWLIGLFKNELQNTEDQIVEILRYVYGYEAA